MTDSDSVARGNGVAGNGSNATQQTAEHAAGPDVGCAQQHALNHVQSGALAPDSSSQIRQVLDHLQELAEEQQSLYRQLRVLAREHVTS